MSNKPANRPSTARKHTTKTDANRDNALSQGYRFNIEGETFQATIGDITPALARELRKETGRGFMGLLSALGNDPDVDLISEAVWVARRAAGEFVSLDEVEVTYAQMLGDDFEVAIAEDEKAATPDPEV